MDTDRGHLVYRFGEFELDTAQRVVVACPGGERLRLTPRVYDTLLYLVEHAGELVTKTALLQAVWAGVIVEEGNLTQTIHVLRRALGESPLEHRYVVTEPRRGYRFVADVSVVAAARVPDPAPVARSRPPWRAARSAVAAGVLLAVAAGLYVQRDRVTDVASSGADLVAAPGESASEGVAALDPRARACLSQAQFYFHRRGAGDLHRARECLEQAQAIEPLDALIPARLSGVYMVLRVEGLLDADAALAGQRAAAERSLQLDPGLAEAQLRMAQYLWATSNVAEARRHFGRGVALDPDHPLALSMRAGQAARRGHLEEAIELQRRSVSQEPLAATQRVNLGAYLLAAGRLGEAEAEFRHADALNPTIADPGLAFTLILQQRHAEALERILRWPADALRDQALALAYDGLGRSRDAERALERLRASGEQDSPLRLAEVLALRGERDAAFEEIARADVSRRRARPACRAAGVEGTHAVAVAVLRGPAPRSTVERPAGQRLSHARAPHEQRAHARARAPSTARRTA